MDKSLKILIKVLTISIIILMICYLVNFGIRLFVQFEALKLLDGEMQGLQLLIEHMPKL